MSHFHAGNFFQLNEFLHAAIFDSQHFVWEALTAISAYLKTQKLGKIEADIPSGAILVHPELISIGKGSVIEPGTYIKGPCIIGKKCTIRQGAYIRGHLIAGDECVIGHCTEIKNSILLNHAKAAHFAYLGESILGNHVNLGAGVKCANLKFDGSPIIIHYEGKHYATHLHKMGAIIGDGSQLGCNSVTNPGTLMGKNSHLLPCVNFGGYAPDDSVIRLETRAQIVPKKKKASE